jgi:glycosyltransferase involved in cell wall biosynthesis
MDRPGVNVVAYFNHVLGLGESARQFAGALRSSGVPHSLAAIHLPPLFPRLPGAAVPWLAEADLPHDTTLVYCNPDRYGIDLDLARLPGRRLVGRWAWELSEPQPGWADAAATLTEIWTASRFVREAVSRGVGVPVRVMPVAVRCPPAPALERARWGLRADRFLFLFMFDHHSQTARKNPVGLIRAFLCAFPGPGEAELLVKSINAASAPTATTELEQAAAPHEHVHLIDAALPDPERLALLAGCDCYVSLHRSEGFGMTIAEAMGYGRPVIATAYGGCTDFYDWATGFPVCWRPTRVGSSSPAYPPDGRWAEPDVVHAAGLMRQVLEQPAAAAGRAQRAAERIATDHSPAAVGRVADQVLRRLSAAG